MWVCTTLAPTQLKSPVLPFWNNLSAFPCIIYMGTWLLQAPATGSYKCVDYKVKCNSTKIKLWRKTDERDIMRDKVKAEVRVEERIWQVSWLPLLCVLFMWPSSRDKCRCVSWWLSFTASDFLKAMSSCPHRQSGNQLSSSHLCLSFSVSCPRPDLGDLEGRKEREGGAGRKR